MARSARYCISRVIKSGVLDVQGTENAIRNAVAIASRAFAWTIVEVKESELIYRRKRFRYLSGKLVKYDPEAIVEVVDAETRKVELRDEPNMQKASSLFVYFPDEAVFGHRYVWNEIRDRDFRSQMKRVIEAFHGDFFVECTLEPISDLTRFLVRLSEMEEIVEIKAKVSPPNPLFGRFWKGLKEYLEERRLGQMALHEKAKSGKSILTSAPNFARAVENREVIEETEARLGDAAVLMAADGYGRAEVTGSLDGQMVVVKTSDTALQIRLASDASVETVAKAVAREIARMSLARFWTH